MQGDNSPVIVVQNKIDQSCRQLPSERYKNEFPNIFDFANVSCAEGYEQTVTPIHYDPIGIDGRLTFQAGV